ncbi:hypothetical protein M8C21_017371, partial [Ambrosia artemisiifolia]
SGFTYSGFPPSTTTKETVATPPSPISSFLSVCQNKPTTSATLTTHDPHFSRHLAALSVNQTPLTTRSATKPPPCPDHSLDFDDERKKSYAVAELKEKVYRIFGRERHVHKVLGGGKGDIRESVPFFTVDIAWAPLLSLIKTSSTNIWLFK